MEIEVKPQFYICMTSGVQGPILDLLPEQAQSISDLASQLMDPWTGIKPSGLAALRPDHYLVYLGENCAVDSVRVLECGFVSMWKQGDSDWRDYTDTVGLWKSLTSYAAEAMIEWHKSLGRI